MTTKLVPFGLTTLLCAALLGCDSGDNGDDGSQDGGSTESTDSEDESMASETEKSEDESNSPQDEEGDSEEESDSNVDSSADDAEEMESESGEEGTEPEEGYINGKIDGELFEGSYSAAAASFSANRVQLTASVGDVAGLGSHAWVIQVINEESSYTCGDGMTPLFVSFTQASPFESYDNRSEDCMITVTKKAAGIGDWIEGSFSGALENISDENSTVTLSEGEFRVQLVQ